jgi:cysteine-S-conjugate beta-lyase
MTFDDLDLERLRRRSSEKWRRYPAPTLPAWVAEMDYPIAPAVRAALLNAVELDDFGYPTLASERAVAEAFAERMRLRYGWSAPAAQAIVLSDVVQGIYLALHTLTAPGDGVLVQTPIYPPFLSCVEDTGRRLVTSPLVATGNSHAIDFDALSAVSRDVRVLLLCHPHNPTGRVFTRTELEMLADLALARDWLVISDEIHADLTHPGSRFTPFASLGPEVAERTITLSSASKAFNIAGLRCAVAHFGGRERMRRVESLLPRHIRGGIGILAQHATVAAWRDGDAWLETVRQTLDAHRHWLLGELRQRLPEIRAVLPEATYLAWLDLRALELDPSPAEFFRRHAHVALSDGVAFGAGFEGYARLNFATSRPLLTEIIERMSRALAAR